jgi:hypothetical protein
MALTQALPSFGTTFGKTVHMLFVFRTNHGVFALQLLELLVSDSGALAMKKLQERLDQEGVLKSRIRLGVLCRRMTVEIAEINLVSDGFGPSLTTVLML